MCQEKLASICFKNCHVIFGEYYKEFICSICTLRKILNQKKEEKEKERKMEEER